MNTKWISHFLAAFDQLQEATRVHWFQILTSLHDDKATQLWLQELYMLPVDAVALVLQHRFDHEREKARKASVAGRQVQGRGATSA
jgi:hypothetical protein